MLRRQPALFAQRRGAHLLAGTQRASFAGADSKRAFATRNGPLFIGQAFLLIYAQLEREKNSWVEISGIKLYSSNLVLYLIVSLAISRHLKLRKKSTHII